MTKPAKKGEQEDKKEGYKQVRQHKKTHTDTNRP